MYILHLIFFLIILLHSGWFQYQFVYSSKFSTKSTYFVMWCDKNVHEKISLFKFSRNADELACSVTSHLQLWLLLIQFHHWKWCRFSFLFILSYMSDKITNHFFFHFPYTLTKNISKWIQKIGFLMEVDGPIGSCIALYIYFFLRLSPLYISN